jgi:hypothetical protein
MILVIQAINKMKATKFIINFSVLGIELLLIIVAYMDSLFVDDKVELLVED